MGKRFEKGRLCYGPKVPSKADQFNRTLQIVPL